MQLCTMLAIHWSTSSMFFYINIYFFNHVSSLSRLLSIIILSFWVFSNFDCLASFASLILLFFILEVLGVLFYIRLLCSDFSYCICKIHRSQATNSISFSFSYYLRRDTMLFIQKRQKFTLKHRGSPPEIHRSHPPGLTVLHW